MANRRLRMSRGSCHLRTFPSSRAYQQDTFHRKPSTHRYTHRRKASCRPCKTPDTCRRYTRPGLPRAGCTIRMWARTPRWMYRSRIGRHKGVGRSHIHNSLRCRSLHSDTRRRRNSSSLEYTCHRRASHPPGMWSIRQRNRRLEWTQARSCRRQAEKQNPQHSSPLRWASRQSQLSLRGLPACRRFRQGRIRRRRATGLVRLRLLSRPFRPMCLCQSWRSRPFGCNDPPSPSYRWDKWHHYKLRAQRSNTRVRGKRDRSARVRVGRIDDGECRLYKPCKP